MLMFYSTELLLKTNHDFAAQSKADGFMIIGLKYFHDSLNIAVILTLGCQFFSPKCARFPLIFTESNYNTKNFLLELLLLIIEISLISTKNLQKLFKDSNTLLKIGKMLSHLHMPSLIIFRFICLWSLLQ